MGCLILLLLPVLALALIYFWAIALGAFVVAVVIGAAFVLVRAALK
jgi:hypothetical protein